MRLLKWENDQSKLPQVLTCFRPTGPLRLSLKGFFGISFEGRLVDNANFIHIKDIASISDEQLYHLLLNEFPVWLKEAANKRIIRK